MASPRPLDGKIPNIIMHCQNHCFRLRGRHFLSKTAGVLLLTLLGAWASTPVSMAANASAAASFTRPEISAALSYTYAFTNGESVPVYKKPEDAALGIAPVRYTGKGFVGFSLLDDQPVVAGGQKWYRVNKDEYIAADQLEIVRPSGFQGVLVPPAMAHQPFAWLIFNSQISPAPGEKAPEDAPKLKGRSIVPVYEVRQVDKHKWCRIGEQQWIDYRRVGLVTPAARPAEVKKSEKWIDVNLTEQILAAYEGDTMKYSTLISAGDSRFPTVQGLYRIWAKHSIGKMSGGDEETSDYYFLEDVPWQMFFYRSYGLHASYWHDYFGLPNSHGCINLSPKDAKWLYEWAAPKQKAAGWLSSTKDNPGTWVLVHE